MTRDIEISLLNKLQKQLEINQVYFETLMKISQLTDVDCDEAPTCARQGIEQGKEIRDRRGE